MSYRLSTLIVGAGAVGGYFGAKLARAANEVVFVARGEHLRALRARGLELRGVGGDFTVAPVRAVDSARGSGPFDLVLVCVKAQDTETALLDVGDELASDALVASLQNGVESEAVIERLLGLPPMLRALAYVGAEVVAPGVIHHASGGSVVIGEPDDRRSPRLERVERFLSSADIEVVVPASIARAKWQKLAWNASFNVIAALTGATIGATLGDPESRRLVEAVMREVEAVAVAQGITFDTDHVTRVLRHAQRNLGFVRPSTLQDREKGKPLEHDALTGAVVRFGKRHGVPTPVCETLDTLARVVSGSAFGATDRSRQ